MKKNCLFVLFIILFSVVSASSAESDLLFTVFDDVVKFIKDPIDETWEQTFDEVMANVNALDGYVCEVSDKTISCVKSDSTGSFRIEFDFINDDLNAIDTYISNSELTNYALTSNSEDFDEQIYMQNLWDSWYSENVRRFFTDLRIDDSVIEKLTKHSWEDARDENIIDVSRYEKILRGEDTIWSEYFFIFPENTYVQSGCRNSSEKDPDFQLRILLASWKYLVTRNSPAANRDFNGSEFIFTKEDSYKNGSCTAVSYYNAQGEPTIHPEYGYAKKIHCFDGDIYVEGLPVSHPEKLTVYYDLDNNAVKNSNGYAYSTTEISEDGNTSTFRYFDADMKPVTFDAGYAAYTLETTIDKTNGGNMKVYKYFDADMKPVTLKDGYAGYSVTGSGVYGTSATNRYFDADGNPVLISGGYAVHYSKEFKPGIYEIHMFYGVDDEPILTDSGYASYGHEFDQEKGCVVYYYRGVNREAVIGPEGYAMKESCLSPKDDPYTEERYLDAHGDLISGPDGYAYNEITKTDEGSTECYFDPKGNRVVIPSINASGIRTIYNASGEIERVEYLGVDNELVLNSYGYAVKEIIRDEDARTKMIRYLDTENHPVLNREGFSYSLETTSDGDSLLAYYDPDGNRVLNKSNDVSAVHTFYTPSGNKERIEFLGVDDELISPDKLNFWHLFYTYGIDSGILYTNWGE